MARFNIGAKKKIYCNTCKNPTHHELKSLHTSVAEEVDYDETGPYLVFEEKNEYFFWICLGCDTATLENAYTHSGMEDEKGKEIWTSLFYPKRQSNDLSTKYFQKISPKLRSIYKEVIASFNSSHKILCAMGLRALLEGVCADKGITNRTLEKRIDALDEYLPQNIVQSLHSFRFMGNEAAHELAGPPISELRLAIEVMEDLMNFLYELDYKAKKLNKRK